MPGVMSWEEMNWLLPDFDETGLIYHGSRSENLVSIFQRGLIPRFKEDPTEQHHIIYEAHYRHRPNFIPNWVDPRKCIFGYMNKARQGGSDGIVDGKVSNAIIGIETADHVIERTWTACFQFSDMVNGPEEAGYFDTPERKAFFKDRMEPIACEAYWKTSLSFAENLKIRLDHLLPMQEYHELLICSEIAPESLSLQGFRVQGSNGRREVLRSDLPEVFLNAEEKLRNNVEIVQELKEVAEFCEQAISA